MRKQTSSVSSSSIALAALSPLLLVLPAKATNSCDYRSHKVFSMEVTSGYSVPSEGGDKFQTFVAYPDLQFVPDPCTGAAVESMMDRRVGQACKE